MYFMCNIRRVCGFEFSIKGFLFCNFKDAAGDDCYYVTLKII